MINQNKPERVLSRRDALKTLAAATGATALATLPGKWETPALEVGVLPAFAQSSATNIPFTSIAEVGQPGSGVRPAEDRGWIAVVVNNGVAVQQLSGADNGITAQQLPVIIPPIRPDERNFNAPAPSWTSISISTTSFTFISKTSDPDSVPADGTQLVCYGISGDMQFEATITASVINRVVIFDFPLPDTYSGVFYFSVNFVATIITLVTEIEIEVLTYVAVGIYAELSIYVIQLPPDPPFLTSGVVSVISANDPIICPFPPPSLPGSELGISLNYVGGNVTAGSKINNFMLFFPSGNISVFPTGQVIITPPTISTDDICIVFNTDSLVYYSVWITDADGQNSNSIGNFFIPIGLNSTDSDELRISTVPSR